MAYSNFVLDEVEEKFSLQLQDHQFLPELQPIAPSSWLQETLSITLPWAKTANSEKARSEFIIAPILLELKTLSSNQISVFSGEDFTVDKESGLNGICDFLISRSPTQFKINAPVIALVEAKKGVLRDGWGQCMAEMVAAQRFNAHRGNSIENIYGIVTSGTLWQFFQMQGTTVNIHPEEQTLAPIDRLLAILYWMVRVEDGNKSRKTIGFSQL
jgi:hypothetical protein